MITKTGKGARRRGVELHGYIRPAIGLDSARGPPFPWTRSRRLSVRSLPRFSRTLEGYGVNQEFHLACAPACHWNACEPNPALGSLSQAASSANLCRSAGKAYQPVGRRPVILLCSIALPASHRIRRSPRACAFTKLIRPDPRAHGQVRPIG